MSTYVPQRRYTGTVHAATSFLKRSKTAPANQGPHTQQIISAYRLDWEKLRNFLLLKFPRDTHPGLKLDKRPINDDKYIVMLPEKLNSDDLIYIDEELRDKKQMNTDQSDEET
ncbi:MAG: hypothetical protein OHK93_004427 [Ramalina farinacea]|uniref:Uncharacterized protein n=1 Tax=Ramalina farinacea TaxID=258253 RepID=A0AA43U0A5_9LECA|nr:hypothetical protein [Ramalina farinacea]